MVPSAVAKRFGLIGTLTIRMGLVMVRGNFELETVPKGDFENLLVEKGCGVIIGNLALCCFVRSRHLDCSDVDVESGFVCRIGLICCDPCDLVEH